MRGLRQYGIENALERMRRLRALAHEARAARQIKYAELLEHQALKAAAEPDGWKTDNLFRFTGGPQNAEALEKLESGKKKRATAFLANGIFAKRGTGALSNGGCCGGFSPANGIRPSRRLLIEGRRG